MLPVTGLTQGELVPLEADMSLDGDKPKIIIEYLLSRV